VASTLSIDVIDITVAPLNPVNIAIINQPNPVSGFSATGEQVLGLIAFPKYEITESATGTPITGENIYVYFPELDPGGGGGGGGDSYTKAQTDALLKGKVDTKTGYGLSQEDYTSSEKTKLSGVEANANNYSLPTATDNALGGVKVGSGLSIDNSGTLSADGITVDSALDTTSENPVQNKVIAGTIGDINTVLEGVL